MIVKLRTNQYLSKNKGGALVELAIILPFLLLVAAGVTELGNVFLQYEALTKSVRDSARYLSKTIGTSLCNGATAQNIITSMVQGNNPPTNGNIGFNSVCVQASGSILLATNRPTIATDCTNANIKGTCAAGEVLHIHVIAAYNYNETMWGYNNILFSPTLTATTIMPVP